MGVMIKINVLLIICIVCITVHVPRPRLPQWDKQVGGLVLHLCLHEVKPVGGSVVVDHCIDDGLVDVPLYLHDRPSEVHQARRSPPGK